MPTYEYECQKCNYTFEKFQNMSDKRLQRCPKCRGKLVRLFGTGAGVLFKGSGFYETDYRSSEYKEAAKKEKSAHASDSESSKKTDKDAAGKAGGKEKTAATAR